MTDHSRLEIVKQAMKNADMHGSNREAFSVEEFSRQSVKRLVEAMEKSRENSDCLTE